MKHHMDFLGGNINKIFFKILFPTVTGMMVHSMYIFFDIMFIGLGVGQTGLAAVNITMPIFTTLSAIGLMIGVGASTTIAIFNGEGDFKQANQVFTLAIIANLILGIIFTVLGTVFLRQFSILLGATPELVQPVMDYMGIIALLSIFYMMSSSLTVLVRADGNPKLVMIATIVSAITNIIFDYIFVFIFNWGVFGAGFATAIGPMVSFLIMSLHFIKKYNKIRFVKPVFDIKLLARIFKNGLGTAILEFTAGISILFYNMALLKVAGEIAVSAYTIISNIAYVFKGVFNGIAQSAQTIISTNFGAGELKRAKHGGRISIITAVSISIVSFILFVIFPKPIVSIFTTDKGLIDIAAKGLVIYFTSIALTALNTMLMYYFQSIEKATYSTIISILRGFILVLISIMILTPIFGINGIWASITLSELLTTGVIILLLYKDKLKLKTTSGK